MSATFGPAAGGGPSLEELGRGLSAAQTGAMTGSQVLALVVAYQHWHVPSQPADDGSPGIRLLAGQSGEQWLMLFSDEQRMREYDRAQGTSLASSFFVARGDSVARHLPAGMAGIGLDVGAPHQSAVNVHQLAELRQLGDAAKAARVEAEATQRAKPPTPVEPPPPAPVAPSPAPETPAEQPEWRPLLPILMPFAFPGAEALVCRPLLGARGDASIQSPWVTYGHDHPDALRLINHRSPLAQRALEDLEAEAIANLAGAVVDWSTPEVPPGAPPLVMCVGQHAVSQILNRDKMQQVASQLNASLLAVALPSLNTLIAANADEAGALEGLAALCLRLYEKAGDEGLSGQLYVVREGKIVGRTKLEAVPADGVGARAAACARCGQQPSADAAWCLDCGASLTSRPPVAQTGPLDRVLPIVQRYDWPGRPHAAHRSLCFMPRLAGTPWLAFRYDVGALTAYVGPERLEVLGVNAEQIEAQAAANLAANAASWRVLPPPQGITEQGIFALMCEEDPNACERLLDKPFMLHAQRMLGGELIVVGIPARGTLFATHVRNVSRFIALAEALYGEAGDAGLTPWCLAVGDGVVRGRFSLEDGAIVLDSWT